ARQDLHVIVGDLPPLASDLTLELMPVAFDLFPVHVALLCEPRGRAIGAPARVAENARASVAEMRLRGAYEPPIDADALVRVSHRMRHSRPSDIANRPGRLEVRMWLEAILSKGDLTTMVERFLPVKIDLGGGTLALHDPSEVTLVEGRGLRVRAK